MATQVADQYPVVSERQAAVAPGNLGEIDADIAFGMTADQQDGPMQGDGGVDSPGRSG